MRQVTIPELRQRANLAAPRAPRRHITAVKLKETLQSGGDSFGTPLIFLAASGRRCSKRWLGHDVGRMNGLNKALDLL
jgi:hypothetical protein